MSPRFFRALHAACLALIAAAPTVTAQIAGTWRVDNARSTGVGPNVGLTLVISESADTFFVERRFRLPQGPVVLQDTMVANGAVLPYTFRAASGLEGRGIRTIKRSGGRLELADSVLIDTQGGPAPRWTTQTWSLNVAGDTLTQAIILRQPFSETPLTNVLVREKKS